MTDMVLTMNEWDYQWASCHKAAAKVGIIQGMDEVFPKVMQEYFSVL